MSHLWRAAISSSSLLVVMISLSGEYGAAMKLFDNVEISFCLSMRRSHADVPHLPVGSGPFLSMVMSTNNILDRFTEIEVDGKKILVPDFAVDDVRLGLTSKEKRQQMGADKNTAEVSHTYHMCTWP